MSQSFCILKYNPGQSPIQVFSFELLLPIIETKASIWRLEVVTNSGQGLRHYSSVPLMPKVKFLLDLWEKFQCHSFVIETSANLEGNNDAVMDLSG